jgi:hypothetical protein
VDEQRRAALAYKFREQQHFAAGYSPLYARLFGAVAAWLERSESFVTGYLLEAGEGRQLLDVTLLLAAGLHRDALAGEPDVSALARFFPGAGGRLPPDAPGFKPALFAAMSTRSQALATFIRTGAIQTNETGRGLCWLLPVHALPWPSIHLVDLGASAGLNLVADRRVYRLATGTGNTPLLDLGSGEPVQFSVRCRGELSALAGLAGRQPPAIASRTGCDLAPVRLATGQDRLNLMAFVWGDQVDRLDRLREGLDALDRTAQEGAPVHVYPAKLPGELEPFLARRVPAEPPSPVVVYNTYFTPYLPHNGATLRRHMERWAASQSRPVLWLQLEPPADEAQAPAYGWCQWTADLWQDGSHRHWFLAWIHPHGAEVDLLPGMLAWNRFWSAT